MKAAAVFLILFSFSALSLAQDGVIEATTASGEKVRLLPNGRWEFADQKKAEVQRAAAQAETSREQRAQGGLFGIGRKIYEGDKDYNRGTLNPAKH
jgi:hypothetical protein